MASRSIHPFPARMAPEIALEAIPERRGNKLVVMDPMCGSGTVLAMALERGHDAIGTDIDPLAVMMSRLAVTRIDPDRMLSTAERVLSWGRDHAGAVPWGKDQETNDFVNFWFGPAQREQLIALASSIERVEDQEQKLAMRMALSRIIVTKTPRASLAADTSHSRPHRVVTSSQYDVFGGFTRSARQLSKYLVQRSLAGQGTVALDDARTLNTIADGTVDLAVTSPPYLNALDYLRGHKLALVWFGYRLGDIRRRRALSIGTERGLDEDSSPLAREIVGLIQESSFDPEALRKPLIRRYAHDCIGFATQLYRTLKPGSKAVLVVGNSTIRGNYIENSRIAQVSMEGSGFVLTDKREREIPPTRRYMAINTNKAESTITRRMRSEVILTLEKAHA